MSRDPTPRVVSGRQFIDVNGLRTRVFVHDGRQHAGGAVVLLIHGAGGNYLQWPSPLRRMAGMLTIAPDLPGHGESAGAALCGAAAYARFVAELIAVLGFAKIVVAGHSMGAAIALEFAHLAPDKVKAIGVLAAGERLPIAVELVELVRTDFEAATMSIVDSSFGPDTPSRMRSIYLKELKMSNPETLLADFAVCTAFDARPFASRLDSPVVIAAGSRDDLVPPASSIALHARMTRSELHILEGAGHMLLWERTETVGRLIADLANCAEQSQTLSRQ